MATTCEGTVRNPDVTAPDAAVESGHSLHTAAFLGSGMRSSLPASPPVDGADTSAAALRSISRHRQTQRGGELPRCNGVVQLISGCLLFAAAALPYVN
jgi:hypothetical protein